ncbi:hypothetical protein AR687_13255 [Flavobacteriaceae bacterium CRH]|nr:hypothetical protein AR687_13255 [Flavobacteriaceae bacterium CRH]
MQDFESFNILKSLYILFFENIKNENKFEINAATIQDRIQKNKKTDLFGQLMLANIKVIKNVVVRF